MMKDIPSNWWKIMFLEYIHYKKRLLLAHQRAGKNIQNASAKVKRHLLTRFYIGKKHQKSSASKSNLLTQKLMRQEKYVLMGPKHFGKSHSCHWKCMSSCLENILLSTHLDPLMAHVTRQHTLLIGVRSIHWERWLFLTCSKCTGVR